MISHLFVPIFICQLLSTKLILTVIRSLSLSRESVLEVVIDISISLHAKKTGKFLIMGCLILFTVFSILIVSYFSYSGLL